MRIFFVVVGLLEKVKIMSQYRVFRSITIAVQKKEKRRIVACLEIASCS